MSDSVSEFQLLMLSDKGPVKVRVFMGSSFILADLTESQMLITQCIQNNHDTFSITMIQPA